MSLLYWSFVTLFLISSFRSLITTLIIKTNFLLAPEFRQFIVKMGSGMLHFFYIKKKQTLLSILFLYAFFIFNLLYCGCPGMMQQLRLTRQMVIMLAMTVGAIEKRYSFKTTWYIFNQQS
jgi:hypothetical protein